MKRQMSIRWLALWMMVVLVLSACGESVNNQGAQETLPAVGQEPGDLASTPEQQETATAAADDAAPAVEATDLPEETAAPTMEATAQSEEVPETGAQADTGDQAEEVIDNPATGLVSDILGTRLVDAQGQDLGEIRDLAYDDHNGIVVYAILTPAESANLSAAHELAFPFTLLTPPADWTPQSIDSGQPSTVPDEMQFGADVQLLRDAPTLQTDNLEEADFALWSEDLFNYWSGTDVNTQIVGVSESTVLAKMSGLERLRIIRAETEEVFQAQDVVVNMGTGDMLYLVIAAGDMLPGEAGLLMIPYDYLRYGTTDDGTVGYIFREGDDELRAFPRLQEGDLMQD